MTIASGIRKITVYKKQTALGAAAAGAGGKEFRRTKSVFKADRDMYESNEIQSHHMSTGASYGLQKCEGQGDFELSPGSYSDLIGSLLERDFTAIPDITSLTLTIAASGSQYTVTRGAGDFMADGIKLGHVVRLSGGTLDPGNINKNLWVTAVTGTTLTVTVLNGSGMAEQAAIASCTVSLPGKVTYTPTTGHTSDYYSVEEWYADLNKSELFTDLKVGAMSLNMPATGNNSGSFGFVGLGRTVGASQVLTSPTASARRITSAINGYVTINSVLQTAVTGITINVDKSAQNAGAVIGSNVGADVTTGRIKVSGTITAQFDSTALRDYIISETAVPVNIVFAIDQAANSHFVSLSLPKVKFWTDTPDDGEKAIIRTYNFTAEYFSSGGASIARLNTILQVQDSAA